MVSRLFFLPYFAADVGLILRRQHRDISDDLNEEPTASINVHAVPRHVSRRSALVRVESLFDAFRIGEAPLSLPMAVLLHVFRVVAEVERLKSELVCS